MNKELKIKNNILLVFIALLCVCIIGCGNGENQDNKKYDESLYTLNMVPEFESTLTFDEAKNAIEKAVSYFATIKSYSFTQVMSGEYDSQYNYQGTTKIDVSGQQPLASVELTGTSEYAFYIVNNKAYLNYNGYKIAKEISSDLSDLASNIESELGSFSSFDMSSLDTASLEYAGIDKNDVTVIKLNISTEERVLIVISNNKLMKVIYNNDDAINYVANYDYNPVTITLPSDLDSYELQ